MPSHDTSNDLPSPEPRNSPLSAPTTPPGVNFGTLPVPDNPIKRGLGSKRSLPALRESFNSRNASETDLHSTAPTWRKSFAAFSDFMSGHHHSARPRGPIRAFSDSTYQDGMSESAEAASSDERADGPDPSASVTSLASHLRRVSAFVTSNQKEKGYDAGFRDELEGDGGNGIRVWYHNFTTIDWIHDTIKESLRIRRLRRLSYRRGWAGWKGRLTNFADGVSGWILVTLVAFITACIAFLIVRAEMWLFDIKEGYCARDVRLAKRFCCAEIIPSNTWTPWSPLLPDHHSLSPGAAIGSSAFMQGWRTNKNEGAEAECPHWKPWGNVFVGASHPKNIGSGWWWANFTSFVVLAIILASASALMTVYLSSSESVYSSKDDPIPTLLGAQSSEPAVDSGAPTHVRIGRAHPDEREPLLNRRKSYGGIVEAASEEEHTEQVTSTPKRKVMFFAAGSGIPEIKTILSGFVIRGYLGSWTLLTKAVGLALSVASGLSLGKEGPFVHIASCVGNILSRFVPKYDRNEAKRREVLSAACAAGVAVAFGSPVGGTLFSLEEVSYYFPPKVMWRSFFCAMIAAVTLRFLDPFGTGKIVLFQVTYDKSWHFPELFGFILLGVFGGVYGAIFAKGNIWWSRVVRNKTWLANHPIIEVALVTLVTVVVSFFNPFTKMGGTELVFELFSECYTSNSFDGLCVTEPNQVWPLIGQIAIALVVKGILTIVTFGIKVPAGIFIPTLAVGACMGRIAGLLIEYAHAMDPTASVFSACRMQAGPSPAPFGQACVLPGVWAMVGAAATLAGVTRTTVSLAVIMFELTGTVGYVVPVMLAVLLAKTVADAIEHRGIYDLVIELAGLPYLDSKHEYHFHLTPYDIVDSSAPVISLNEENTLKSLATKLATMRREGNGSGFPIISTHGNRRKMHGYLAATELEHGLASFGFEDESTVCTFQTATSNSGGGGQLDDTTTTTCDFGYLTDQAPITVNIRSPMELLHEMFVKLGVRYLIVTDEGGGYHGVIEKNLWLAYLHWTEENDGEEFKAESDNRPGLP